MIETKAPEERAEKVKESPQPPKKPDISVIVKKTYRMAERLRNFPLPGE